MKLPVEARMWTEPRFEALRHALDLDTPTTLGILVMFWHSTRSAHLRAATLDELAKHAPVPEHLRHPLLLQLVAQGYLTGTGQGTFAIEGNDAAVAILEKRRHAAHMGRQAQLESMRKAALPVRQTRNEPPKQAVVKAPKAAETEAKKEANRRAWEAYRLAFVGKYGLEPTRNQKVNSQLAAFVARVGLDDAPRVIEFFVGHADMRYERGMHQVGMALSDAEALHAQWRMAQRGLHHGSAGGDMGAQIARIRRGQV